jgi:hypothetical protein
MKKTALCLVLAAAVAGLFAATALASSLPQFKDPTIKVKGKPSIGGVTIGMPEAKAIAAWGAGRGKCEKSATTGNAACEYGSLEGPSGYAVISFVNGKANAAQIFAGKSSGTGCDPSKIPGAFRKVKTAEGIGLGAKLAELEKAYPDGAPTSGPSPEQFSVGVGANMVVFGLTDRKVCGIGIHA